MNKFKTWKTEKVVFNWPADVEAGATVSGNQALRTILAHRQN